MNFCHPASLSCAVWTSSSCHWNCSSMVTASTINVSSSTIRNFLCFDRAHETDDYRTPSGFWFAHLIIAEVEFLDIHQTVTPTYHCCNFSLLQFGCQQRRYQIESS